MTPLERIARALFRADYPEYVDDNLEIEELGMIPYERRHLYYVEAARAVLQAIREPSEAMNNAGMTEADKDSFGVAVQPIWRAMVDAALEKP